MGTKILEYQWLQPIKNQGTNTTYEPTIEFLTKTEAHDKGLSIPVKETERARIKYPTAYQDLEDILFLCKVNLKNFEKEKGKNISTKEEAQTVKDLVGAHVKNMLVKYKMQYTNRKYAIYFDKRQERNLLPPNDILNKDNKEASMWFYIFIETNSIPYSMSNNIGICEAFEKLINIFQENKDLYFTTSEEQKQRILKADPKATFPEYDFVQTKLDFYELKALLLNEECKKNVSEKRKPQAIVKIKPEELAFYPAHGHSTLMIRYKGMYYGYYTSSYYIANRDTNKNLSYMDGLTREETIRQIRTEQVLGKSFVKDCFPNMNNKQIQEHCMNRLEVLDTTNYTTNFDYDYIDALRFCQERGLNEAAQFIVKNFPDRELVAKHMVGREFSSWIPIYDYIRTGNLEMVKFFYEQGADFNYNLHIIESAAKENQLEILKFFFSKFEKNLRDSWDEVGEQFIQQVFKDCHDDILDYLAQKGFYPNEVESRKDYIIDIYGKETADMLQRHKKLFYAQKKIKQERKAAEEKAYKKQQKEKEDKKKIELINTLGSSNKTIKDKIKNLSSDKLYQLENILK